MTEKALALRLADALEAYWGADLGHDRERQAAAELRRLHAVNAELLEALKAMLSHTAELDPMQGYRPEEDFTAVKQARAAIAKAEGEAK
jgi:hypothetical protein